MAWITVDQMREEILRVYPEDGWRYRVLEMSDRQVAAIYNRMLSEGKLKKEPDKKLETPPALWGKPAILNVAKVNYVVAEDEIFVGEQLKFDI